MTSTPNPTATSSSTSAVAAAAAAAPPSPSPSTPATFEFPREYHFPPFFTRQTNLTTRHSQLEKWAALVLAYCRHHRIYRLALSYAGAPHEELFHNRRIGRRLSPADAREVFDHMRRDGRAEYVVPGGERGGGGGLGGLVGGITGDRDRGEDERGGGGGAGGGGGGEGGDVVWVYWKTPEEWAGLIEAWVEDTAQKNTVLTLYELTEGEGTRGTEFHGLDPEILQKALQVLVKRGKAQIFGQEDQRGVKFF
ncbi:ESCRT-II complex, vps25 subunit [Biscogniauxia marginata]|nr:ESCRT-II complex, vps25 subunit [Biscogniauxia marginata]